MGPTDVPSLTSGKSSRVPPRAVFQILMLKFRLAPQLGAVEYLRVTEIVLSTKSSPGAKATFGLYVAEVALEDITLTSAKELNTY